MECAVGTNVFFVLNFLFLRILWVYRARAGSISFAMLCATSHPDWQWPPRVLSCVCFSPYAFGLQKARYCCNRLCRLACMRSRVLICSVCILSPSVRCIFSYLSSREEQLSIVRDRGRIVILASMPGLRRGVHRRAVPPDKGYTCTGSRIAGARSNRRANRDPRARGDRGSGRDPSSGIDICPDRDSGAGRHGRAG